MNTSVVIPCYNAENDVREAVESVLQQNAIQRIGELVIVDDGSEDNTAEVAKRLAGQHERVTYIRQSNRGPSAARNKGVRATTEPYVSFLDADDLWHENKLEEQFSFLESNQGVSLLCSDFLVKDRDRQKRVRVRYLDQDRPETLKNLFLRGGPVMTSTVVMKRAHFEELEGFNEDLPIGQDTDLWLRTAARYTVRNLPKALVTKRSRKDSVSANKEEKVKYLRRITDHIVELYPQLEPLRDRRFAILEESLARYWLQRCNVTKTREAACRGLQYSPFSVGSYVLLAITMLPLSCGEMRSILGTIGNLHRATARRLSAVMARVDNLI